MITRRMLVIRRVLQHFAKINSVLAELVKNEVSTNFVREKKTISCLLTVNIKALKKKKSVMQCYNGQKFYHGESNCHATAKCVSEKDQESRSWQKDKEEEPRCAKCEEAHKTSYKGCKNFLNPKKVAGPTKHLTSKTNDGKATAATTKVTSNLSALPPTTT